MPQLKILAVDDSPTMRRIIVKTLKRAGYDDITEAADGREALARMKVDDFNFIITDWNMSGMSGLSLTRALRAGAGTKDIPILMVNTQSVKEDIAEALGAGVNNCIVKPFTPDSVKAKIEQILAEV